MLSDQVVDATQNTMKSEHGNIITTLGTDDNQKVMEVSEDEISDTDMDVASEIINRSPI